ncbi:MAG: hypothetical protein ACREBS_07200 [Nitrososphaerales archaeon]
MTISSKVPVSTLAGVRQESRPAELHGIDTSIVQGIMETFGYGCSIQGSLRGMTGHLHEYDYVCRKDGERLIIEGYAPKDADSAEIDIVKLRLKTFDSCPDVVIVILQNTPPQVLREIAERYGYFLIQPTKEKSAYSQLEDLLRMMQELE